MKKTPLTPLCKIAESYGTDKCPQIKHHYTPFYYDLFKNKRNKVKKVVELGIGYYKDMQKQELIYDRGLNRIYHRGASLYMWRDFFPKAKIYGADIRPEAMFKDVRIKTFVVDERKNEDLEKLIKEIGADIDIFIDDASHKVADQIFTAKVVLPLLKKGATYIIEDVSRSRHITEALKEYPDKYVQDLPRKERGGMLYIINL